MSFSSLPKDILIDTLLPLPYYQLQNLCLTNKQINQLCNSYEFWNR